MTEAAIQYNLTDIQHRLRYGRARQLVQEFMNSTDKNRKINMVAMGIERPLSLYNSCYQTAKRHYPGCRVGRENKDYLVFEKV